VPYGSTMIRSAADLDHPDSAWNRAAARSPQGDLFCCRTEWQLSVQEVFFPKRRLHLRESGAAVLALAERDYPGLGATLEPLDSLWLFGSSLLGPGAADLLEAFLGERAAAGRSANLLLSGVLPDDPLRERILRSFNRRFDLYRAKTVGVCSASLDGGLDGFLARRSPLFRKRLRQAARRGTEKGVRFERVELRSEAEADAAFRRMLAVERTSWKGIGHCGMTEKGSSRFYRALARRLALSGTGRAIFACAEERDVGFIFGGLAQHCYRGQQFSYAEDWSHESIGSLLQQEQIRWLEEEGIVRYDMGPVMDYKHHWTEIQIGMEVLLLRPKAGTRVAPGGPG
jgi:CelD/BcsL family acetyltransferase involved in cellulose biosynthesis